MWKHVYAVSTEYEVTITTTVLDHMFLTLTGLCTLQGKSHSPTPPTGQHLGEAWSVFLELTDWHTNENLVLLSLSSLAPWGLWVKFPVSHHARGQAPISPAPLTPWESLLQSPCETDTAARNCHLASGEKILVATFLSRAINPQL